MSEAAPSSGGITPGTLFGPYEIVSLLGSGGMGAVYRARDSRLNRDVALKIILIEYCSDEVRRRRFESEARSAAQLTHPSIVAIYDVGEQRGVPYLVTELVGGGTLADRLRRSRLTPEETIALALPIAQGLAEAHSRGIIHRDLKPANILLTPDGNPKIADFGLAKCLEPAGESHDSHLSTAVASISGHGTIVGTPAYMSPEQAAGTSVDFRSDQFSFASMLLEMTTGQRPFERPTSVQTLAAILDEEPDYDQLSQVVPPKLLGIIRRCLEKDPQRRYGSTNDLVHDLSGVGSERRPIPVRRSLAITSVLLLAAAGAAVVAWLIVNRTTAHSAPTTLAVLPFRNVNRDPALSHFGLGLADSLITRLASFPTLTVRPTSAVARYESEATDATDAGRGLAVGNVLEGTFQHRDRSTRVTAQLTDVATGATVWSHTIDLDEGELFKVEDLVSLQIADALKVRLTPAQRQVATDERRVPDELMEQYLSVRAELGLLNRRGRAARSERLERVNAILVREPNFARALGTRAHIEGMFNFWEPSREWYDRALADANRALTLDPDLVEPRLVRAHLMYSATGGWRTLDSLKELRACAALAPGSEMAHLDLVRMYRHLGHVDDLERELAILRRINPQNPEIGRFSAYALLERGDCADALRQFMAVKPTEGDPYPLWQQIAVARIQCGETRSMLSEMEARVAATPPDAIESAMSYALLALARSASGDLNVSALEKEALSRDQRMGHFHHALFALADVRALHNDVPGAIGYLRRAAETGMPCIKCFDTDPLLSNVRRAPEYSAFIRDLRLQETRSR